MNDFIKNILMACGIVFIVLCVYSLLTKSVEQRSKDGAILNDTAKEVFVVFKRLVVETDLFLVVGGFFLIGTVPVMFRLFKILLRDY